MTDTTRLLRGLEDYIAALDRHLVHLRDQGTNIDAAWARLREVYRGQGAEVHSAGPARSRRSPWPVRRA
jgi:hypothetical protein